MLVPRRFAKPPSFMGTTIELTFTNIIVWAVVASRIDLTFGTILAAMLHGGCIYMTMTNPFFLRSVMLIWFSRNREAMTRDGELYV